MNGNTHHPIAKNILGALILSLLVSSCSGDESATPEVSTTPEVSATPEAWTIPEYVLQGEETFFIAEIEEESIEAAHPLEQAPYAIGAHVDADTRAVSGSATADDRGFVAFEDPILQAIVPIYVVDRSGMPLMGSVVRYLAIDGSVLLLASDPEDEMAGGVAILSYESLQGAWSSISILDAIGDFFLPAPAYAADERALLPGVVAAIVIVVSVASSYFFLENLYTLFHEPYEWQESASTQQPYLCTTAEYIAAKQELASDVAMMVVPLGRLVGEVGEFVVEVGSTVEDITEALQAESADEPVLVNLYYHELGQTSNLITSATTFELVTYEVIGSCAEIPDLDGWRLGEATDALLGLGFDESKVIVQSVDGASLSLHDSFDWQVVEQTPKPLSLWAIGTWPDLNNAITLAAQPPDYSGTIFGTWEWDRSTCRTSWISMDHPRYADRYDTVIIAPADDGMAMVSYSEHRGERNPPTGPYAMALPQELIYETVGDLEFRDDAGNVSFIETYYNTYTYRLEQDGRLFYKLEVDAYIDGVYSRSNWWQWYFVRIDN